MMKPWREVARPHRDVLEGTFQQSEFAADISRVANGTATAEYQDPKAFFARTYVTEGMKDLLVSVAKRLSGTGGEPIIELQTNFGGGKTHSLLAVYHLANRQCPISELTGLGDVLAEAGVADVPQAKVAVIDGIAISPSQPIELDGQKINTVWGFIAWQLLGAEGYAKVAASDAAGTSPGKQVVRDLLAAAGPSVILMDELVAYYRQFNTPAALTGGTFESNMSFVQALTEAVKGVPNVILLASLPESDSEAAGAFGAQVLMTLEKTFGRLDSIWKPVSAAEGFEIVKRRLFEEITDVAAVETTCRAFADCYRENKDNLPKELQDGSCLETMRKCYPIHPEIFARFYEDWSTLPKFQKTRGVLQYMAIVINRLWEAKTDEPLILPGSIPLCDGAVANKSTQYLSNGWGAIIDREIDGERSFPQQIDNGDPRLGSIHAAVRVARSIFLGSAPGVAAQHVRGIDDKHIFLGCIVPGQELSFYADALRKLREKLHYLFNQDDNYWYDTKPTLKRTMESYKDRYTGQQIEEHLSVAIRQKWGNSSVVAAYHIFPSHRDVPDDITNGVRLVILPLSVAYAQAGETRTFAAAKEFLDNHGTNPRMRKNRLVFLAADLNSMVSLTDICKTVLAWRDVKDAIRNGAINATLQDSEQVGVQLAQCQRLLDGMILNAFRYLLVPNADGPSAVSFDVRKLQHSSTDQLGMVVERALLNEDDVIRSWSPLMLKRMLEQNYFKNGVTEVSTRKLWTDMASFYYLPRIVSADAFLSTVLRGVADGGFFGYAQGKEGDRYLGFKYGENPGLVNISDAELIIEDSAAVAWKNTLNRTQPNTAAPVPVVTPVPPTPTVQGSQPVPQPLPPTTAKRLFTGMVTLDLTNGVEPLRQVLDEVLSNLSGTGARVTVQLDVNARNVNPFAPQTVRAVSENARTLGFARHEFS